MKIIEERAKRFAKMDLPLPQDMMTTNLQRGWFEGYVAGATEQSSIDDTYWTDKLIKCAKEACKCQGKLVEKACILLHDLLIGEDETYLGNAGILKDKIDKFRKEIEE